MFGYLKRGIIMRLRMVSPNLMSHMTGYWGEMKDQLTRHQHITTPYQQLKMSYLCLSVS